MKKVTCLLAALLLMCGLSWAQQITWSAADQGYENGQVIESVDFNDYVAGEFFKGSNNNEPKYYTTGAAIRCYGGNYFTITSDYVLTEIVFGFASGEGSNAITSDVGTYENGTWTGSANEVTFTIGGTTGHRRFATFTITYDEGGSPAPSITASNVEIAYDATEGAIAYTINNGVEGGVLTAATEAEWLTIGTIGETVPFTCTVNPDGERTATVTLTYTYDTDQTVTKNVTVTQTTNPNIPGTQNNPYTVAQAIAAIDAGAGTQGVYATGIVSVIVTDYNSQYGNITFDIVDAAGDEAYLRAYRCGGDEAANVAVGDVVVVMGNLTYYTSQGIYEFAQGCTLVSLTHPVNTDPSITVDPATVSVDAEEHDGTLALTYENLTITDMSDFDIQYYDAEGEEASEPDWIEVLVAEQDPEIGEGYVVSYYMFENEGEARSAYFKVFAAGDEDFVYSNLVTINQEAYVAPALDYATLPFEFNGGKADIEGTDGLTAEGLGNDYNSAPKLRFDGTGDWLLLHFEGVPGELAFDIKGNSFSEGTFTVQTSEDGETYTDFATYTELGATEHEVFNNLGEDVRYIKWIYTEKVNGNVALGNITLGEYTGPVASITFDPDVVDLEAATQTIQIPFTYENIVVTNYESFTVHHYDAEGEEIQLPETPWYIAGVTGTNDNGYNLTVFVSANEGEARSAYMKVSALDAAGNTVYSNLVTINQDAPEIPFVGATYSLATYIESGRHYIITNGNDRAMGAQNISNNGSQGNNRTAVEISTVDGVAQVSSADVVEFVINGPDINGNYFIYDASYEASFYGYLFAASSSGNHLKTEEFLDDNGNGLWTITFDEENNNAVITAQGNNTHNLMRYNSGNDIFSCYTGGQQDIYLFVKDDDTYEFYMDIKGYTEGENDNWYAISTPVNTNPTNVNHMLDETFDLYKYDPTVNGEEWQNYRINNFTLTPGEGYLYANENNVTLRFTGTADELYNGDGTVALPYYDEENEDLCWNLVGNPFGYAAYTLAWDFYVMKEDGSDFELAEREMLKPFEAIFVKAEYEGEETFFFNDDVHGGGTGGDTVTVRSKLNLRVSDENGKGDFARVRFGEGNNLEKFMLNPTNTKLYFPMEDDNYAVVCADNMGEMPLNFSAAADGDYTLNVNPENMEMEYLHLIDNMTGTDVDLLATPSYSFHARVNDNAARFTLVFANLTGMAENNVDQFAFFSNGNFIVSNEGNAMLQVVDMTGRIVKSETLNGTTSVSVNATPGVYMLRLVNGDNVKVQKVVVK